VPSNEHRSVLLHESIGVLDIRPDSKVVDATLGGAGHAIEIIKKLNENGIFIGIDADRDAIDRARNALKTAKPKIHLINDDFRNANNILENLKIREVDACLFDLGWSVFHLSVGRGFSFKNNEPLLMTFSQDIKEESLTASKIVNNWEESSISDILWGWGEEKYSRQIAKAIVEYRKTNPIETTQDLTKIINDSVPSWYRHRKIHPATKTFQALRIAVNDEIGAINEGLNSIFNHLSSGGKIASITFHSVEDRVVKRLFREWKNKGYGKAPKLIKPTKEEVENNPRARSSKLRVFEKF
jgi:16S rRNA (cytosine1402-N4)-methyltransferase